MLPVRLTLAAIALATLPLAAVAADSAAPPATPAPDPGARQFSKCAACHAREPGVHRMGPSLAGLAGRKAGSAAGFAYSTAMRDSGIVWTRETLAAFLEKPAQFVPGNVMPFAGLARADQRAALVDYLLREP